LDDDDFDYFSQWNWHAGQVKPNHFYAMRSEGTKTVYLHIEIMKRHCGNPPAGHVVDHCDGDGLDNRKENLRYATRRMNTDNNLHRRRREWNDSRITQAVA
jgi:hypothetical protein